MLAAESGQIEAQGGALRAPRADASARPLPWEARPACGGWTKPRNSYGAPFRD
jgi:hypothetical protein